MTRTWAPREAMDDWAPVLVDAFETEARQLRTVAAILRRPRVDARGEGAPQNWVYALQRVLLTLEEARKRRRALQTALLGRGMAVWRDASPPVRASRDRLLAVGREVERELSRARRARDQVLCQPDQEPEPAR